MLLDLLVFFIGIGGCMYALLAITYGYNPNDKYQDLKIIISLAISALIITLKLLL